MVKPMEGDLPVCLVGEGKVKQMDGPKAREEG